MKKLFAKVTAAISAAAMFAVPAINVNAADINLKRDYLVNNRTYHRVVWKDDKGLSENIGYEDVLLGDVNETGTITYADATAIIQYLGNPDKYDVDLYTADVNGDGIINEDDANLIRKYVSGNINNFASVQPYDNNWIWENTYKTYRVYVNCDNTYSTVLIGDVDNDGKIKESDVSAIDYGKKNGFDSFYDGKGNSGTRARRAADVDNNGSIDQKDIAYIRQVANGEKTNFDFLY